MCCFKTLIAVRPAMRGSFAFATSITTGNKCAATPKVLITPGLHRFLECGEVTRCIVRCMDPNACPLCGAWLFANRCCRCGWPKAKGRKPRLKSAPRNCCGRQDLLHPRLRLACRGQTPLLAALSAVAETGPSESSDRTWLLPWHATWAD